MDDLEFRIFESRPVCLRLTHGHLKKTEGGVLFFGVWRLSLFRLLTPSDSEIQCEGFQELLERDKKTEINRR